jgi:hypothetical protein
MSSWGPTGSPGPAAADDEAAWVWASPVELLPWHAPQCLELAFDGGQVRLLGIRELGYEGAGGALDVAEQRYLPTPRGATPKTWRGRA